MGPGAYPKGPDILIKAGIRWGCQGDRTCKARATGPIGSVDRQALPWGTLRIVTKLREMARRPRWQILIVYLLAQGLYLSTLAPTVMWGRDARPTKICRLKPIDGYDGGSDTWVDNGKGEADD